MAQLILNIEDKSLIPGLKQILGAIKGVTIDKFVADNTAAEKEKQFSTNTITQGYKQAQEGKFAGKNLSSLDDLVKELRTEAE